MSTAEYALKPFEPEEFIFVAFFRHAKTGKILYARDFGKKAFRIRVTKRPKEANPNQPF